MEMGVRREIRTTEPLPEINQFLVQAAEHASRTLGRDHNRMLELGLLNITSEEVGTSHSQPPFSENRLHCLWLNDERIAVVLETRDLRNNVVLDYVYFGVREGLPS